MSPAEAYSRSCAEAGIDVEPVVAAALAETSGRLEFSGIILVRAFRGFGHTEAKLTAAASLLSNYTDPRCPLRRSVHDTVLRARLMRYPCRPGQNETQALCLAQALRSARGIRDVDIKDVPLSPTAASRLAEALAALETVDHLCLANVALGDDGAEAMLARTCAHRARTSAAHTHSRGHCCAYISSELQLDPHAQLSRLLSQPKPPYWNPSGLFTAQVWGC